MRQAYQISEFPQVIVMESRSFDPLNPKAARSEVKTLSPLQSGCLGRKAAFGPRQQKARFRPKLTLAQRIEVGS
jgi:hypothetical protein